MADVVLVDVQTGSVDTTSTFTIPKPVGLVNGDFLVLFHAVSYDSTDPSGPPSGFTAYQNSVTQGTDTTSPKARISFKAVTNAGSEPANYTIPASTNGNHAAVLAAFRNVDVANPWLLAATWDPTANALTHTIPTRTMPSDGLFVGFFTSQFYTATKATTWTKPSQMAVVGQKSDVFTNLLIAMEQRAAGAIGARTATVSNTGSAGRTGSLALRPVSAAVTAPTVDAGADATVTLGGVFARTATENNNGGTITSRAWTILSGPSGVGSTLGTAAAISWTPSVVGAYVLRYSATNSAGSGTDDVAVTVNSTPPTGPEPGRFLLAY